MDANETLTNGAHAARDTQQEQSAPTSDAAAAKAPLSTIDDSAAVETGSTSQTMRLDPIREDAERYIAALAGSTDAKVTFQTFRDDGTKEPPWPQILHGTLSQHWNHLVALNRKGHGIFMMVNAGNGNGRKEVAVIRLRALFIDDDGHAAPVAFNGEGEAPFSKLAPTMTVQSKNGQHNYFQLRDDEALERFTGAQIDLAKHFNTDDAVKDLARVMRVAGFFHLKDPTNPFLVKLVQSRPERYTIAQILEAYPAPIAQPAKPPRASSPPVATARKSSAAIDQAKKYLATAPQAIEGQSGNNTAYTVCTTLARGFNLTDDEALVAIQEWNQTCQPPWSEDELRALINHGRKYGHEEIGARIKSEWTDELAYVVPREGYYYRLKSGQWDLASPIKRDAASKHLISCGLTSEEAEKMINENKLVIAHGSDCFPSEESVFEQKGFKMLNSYIPPTIVPKQGAYPTIRKIIEKVTDGDRAGAGYLFNWFAYKTQNPGWRNMTAIVFHGEQGTGKGTLEFIIANIIGIDNVAFISQGDLEGDFNGHYVTKLMVFADEVVSKENMVKTAGALKQYVTDGKIQVNTKNVKQYPTPNRMSWIFSSNSSTPVRIEGEGDRRYTIFTNTKVPSDDYKAMLLGLYKKPDEFTPEFMAEVEAFAYDLLHHEVDVNRAKQVYQNRARTEQIKVNRSSAELFLIEVDEIGIDCLIEDYLETLEAPFHAAVWDYGAEGLDAKIVYEAYRHFSAGNGNSPLNGANFCKELYAKRPGVEKKRLKKGKRPYAIVGLQRSKQQPPAAVECSESKCN